MITITAQSTKIMALVACRFHWQWLADNPGKDKDDWPEFDPSTRDECYCCEYMQHQPIDRKTNRLDCKNCPLSGYAWELDKLPACMRAGSAYSEWCDLMDKWYDGDHSDELKAQLSAAAQKMVDACTEALEDVE